MRLSIAFLIISIVTLAFYSPFHEVSSNRVILHKSSKTLKPLNNYKGSTISYTTLSITKTVSSQDIYVNQPFKIYVTITNFGDATAFNVTLTEKFFPDYLFNSTGPENITFQRIANGSTCYYSYELIPQKEGIYEILPTKVTFFDEEGFSYTAESNNLTIEVETKEPTHIDYQEKWLIIGIFICVLSFVILGTRLLLVRSDK
ncbi:MAG: BatD family protein [Promethearchaeota archaeon]